MAQRHELKTDGLSDLSGRQFVMRVEVSVEEGDGDGGEALSQGRFKITPQGFSVERAKNCARSVEALLGLHDPRIEGFSPNDRQREEIGSRLIADQDGI